MFTSRAMPTETSKQILDAMTRGEIALVYVREPSEYVAERIHGAMLFPRSTFDPADLPGAVGKQIALQCGSGKRSGMAYPRALTPNVAKRSPISAGIMAWKRAGLPFLSADPSNGAICDRFLNEGQGHA